MRPRDPELARLLASAVVPVRLVSLKGVDLSLFDFDFEQTLTVLLMDPSGNTHFRWTASDDDPTALAGLKDLLLRKWPIGKGRNPTKAPRTLADNPRFRQTKRFSEACWHCHYAADAGVADARARPDFDKASLYRYPPPATWGLAIAGAGSTRVKSVSPGSVAASAGLQAGDVLRRIDRRPVNTIADIRFAFDRIPKDQDSARIELERGGQKIERTAKLTAGWRAYDISDRPSQGMVPPILGIWEERLEPEERTRLRIPTDQLALKVSFLFPGERWVASRGELKIGDVVVGVDGKPLPDMNARQFHTWVRMNRNVGETLRLDIIRDGSRRTLDVPCTDPGFEG